ncbi:MAG TPA: 2-oxoacid:acceptor oxidoreductase [Clostridiales bacterium]|nr:2-oxoacid:acceptor oxidoreductase [Clostridiales bacterium]
MANIKFNAMKKCKGCLLCMHVCPVGAISLSGELGEKGYEVVKVDAEKCIGCGSCYRMCPDYVIEIAD